MCAYPCWIATKFEPPQSPILLNFWARTPSINRRITERWQNKGAWLRLCSIQNIYWANLSLSLLAAASICVSNSQFNTAVLIGSSVGAKSFSAPYTNSTAAFNWLGLLYRYAAVVLMLRWPASVFKMWIAVPLLARFVKKVLRPLWLLAPSSPAPS